MPTSLAVQLRHTARCVQAVEQGRSLAEVLPQVPSRLRPGVQALTFHALRQLGTTRALLACLVQRKPDPAVQALMCCALSLLLTEAVETSGAPAPETPSYSAHTVVNQVVDAAKTDRSLQRQSAFINACLRRFLREREILLGRVADQPQARWNHPLWWIERLQRDHPNHWQAILEANNRPGPMSLRVNRRKTDRLTYARELAAAGIDATLFGTDGLELRVPHPVERLPGFDQGLCSVQDEAAQMAAGLLLQGREWAPDDRVLDACAAPGGKTAHVLELANVQMLALDLDPKRCERIHHNLHRLGLTAQVLSADAARADAWWDGKRFDAILLDAPCTASGIVRRHPDVRWLRRASDVDQLARIQRNLLDALWPLVKPGGRLVYATCSVFRAEGQDQVPAFLERHTDAVLCPSPGHLLPGHASPAREFNDNHSGGHDGFFYARFDKAPH
ncbi:16S rRNA (cytosine(967)-C(5))-methyltransferase RsmB [Hydrogenophaga sp.]|uniref:16S rRNA (cytosine(967)-C(5))-methyltransferase RsmB n=1 Tax=Hydrogenophaga sp. TaxID=1904254 RepID=UPI00271F8464|nr:16S rRNA (cytosine(967)-C(5))-methyltransferase RsmB [Hydrogenophaga sp.]MDO8905574.1 16S rRNA (cytosine(967)-C(5))-methyltransferase RsmB [Hydrogenophaga sp.]